MSYRVKRSGLPPSAVLFSCLFAAQAAILVVSPILPQIAEEFEVSTAAAAQLRSISGVTAAIVALVLAATGERFRLSTLLGLGLLLLALGSLASAWAPAFSVLLVLQVVIGVGLALVLSGGLAASDSWAESGESARVLSWALVGQPVAWIVGQPIVGFVASWDWRWAWIVVPFASSLLALGTLARRAASTPDEGRNCDPAGLWKVRGAKLWAFGELVAFTAWAGTLIYAGTFFIEVYGSSVEATGLILGVGAAAYLPGNFLARRWLDKGATLLLAGFALAAAGAVAAFAGLHISVTFSTLTFSVLAFFSAGRTIAGAARGLQLAEGRRLTAMSLRTSMVQFGYLLGAVIGGALLTTWGFSGVAWGFALLFLIAVALQIPRLLGGGIREPAVSQLFRRSRANSGI